MLCGCKIKHVRVMIGHTHFFGRRSPTRHRRLTIPTQKDTGDVQDKQDLAAVPKCFVEVGGYRCLVCHEDRSGATISCSTKIWERMGCTTFAKHLLVDCCLGLAPTTHSPDADLFPTSPSQHWLGQRLHLAQLLHHVQLGLVFEAQGCGVRQGDAQGSETPAVAGQHVCIWCLGG